MAIKLRDLLRNYGIIPFGEDLDEDFQDFLSLNDEFEDILLISKLKKSIKEIRKWKYFQYFGTIRRDENDILSNDEKKGIHRSKSHKIKKLGLSPKEKRSSKFFLLIFFK